jgi:SAM-dependent methyltransferase
MRASLDSQLERRALVCPLTHDPLKRAGDVLRSATHSYPIINGVPVFVDRVEQDSPMALEYAAPRERFAWLKYWLRRSDYRTKRSIAALNRVLDVPPESLCISIGGGPLRASEQFLNLNIGLFQNVDVVGDAHRLPYADESIDAVHSEAVFEHLHSPTVAARELARVLKPGAHAYVCTPFLQPFHGYPSHFQNFTETGHRRLFEDAGLDVVESGVCVGPMMTMLQLGRTFCDTFLPRVLRPLSRAAYLVGRLALAPFDRILGERDDAYVMACTTYLVARKRE